MNDFDIVYDIHYANDYYNIQNLLVKVQQMQDQRIAKGFLFDVAVKENQQLLQLLMEELMPTEEGQNETYYYNLHNLYVEKLLGDCRTILEDFIYDYTNEDVLDIVGLTEDPNFENFINSISKEDSDRMLKYCLTYEYYELIPLFKK